MPMAARVGDPTNHPGSIVGPGVASVLIANMPASVVGDTHTCTFGAGTPAAHTLTPMASGSSSVLIGGLPAVRVGDPAGCMATVVSGEPTVLIGG